jgi:hypothetical protein
MAAKLDWNLEKLRFYLLFSLIVLVAVAVSGCVGYLAQSTHHSGFSIAVAEIPLCSIVLIVVLYYWLGDGVRNDLTSLSAVWLWQISARAINKRYLNYVKGHELRSEIYRQLDSGKAEIRLVTILPGEGRDAIKCTLDYTALGSNGSIYEALSYTWGSNHLLRSIVLNDTPFHITRNLEIALRHLRLPHTSRQVWIDAICINQDDDVERGEQIQLMRKIYTQAEQVLVWLGEASSCSDIAMEFLEVGDGKPDTNEWFKDTIVKTTQGLYTSQWESVFLLQTREYWRRTWIVQEITSAAKLELLCGSRCVSWDTFISCLSAWYRLGHSPSDDALQLSMTHIQAPRVDAAVIRSVFPDRKVLDLWRAPRIAPVQFERNRIAQKTSANSRRLTDFMLNHHDSHATDERDKIYAFAGISSDCQFSGLDIDYSVPTWTVYLKILAYLLENTGRLDMITYCGIGKQCLGRPTWTPTFYWGELQGHALHTSQQLFGYVGSDAFAASKDTQAKAQFIACRRTFDRLLGVDRTILQAEGTCVDIISYRLLYSNNHGTWKLGVDSKTQRGYRTTSSSWMSTKERRHRLDLIKFLFNFVMRIPSPSHVNEGQMATPKERQEEFFRALICDRTAGGLRAPEEWSEAFAVLLIGPSRVPVAYEAQSSTSNAPSRIERARSFVGPFLTAAENTFCGDFWLFLTQKGRLGIANKNAKVGDKICVLLGCNMPLVIRQTNRRQKEDAITATVHGSAYLHYYMDGKAIEELDAGRAGLTRFSLK